MNLQRFRSLCDNVTAQKPITKWEQTKKQTHTKIIQKQGHLYHLDGDDDDDDKRLHIEVTAAAPEVFNCR
jgi:hypothetical protein